MSCVIAYLLKDVSEVGPEWRSVDAVAWVCKDFDIDANQEGSTKQGLIWAIRYRLVGVHKVCIVSSIESILK